MIAKKKHDGRVTSRDGSRELRIRISGTAHASLRLIAAVRRETINRQAEAILDRAAPAEWSQVREKEWRNTIVTK